MNNDYLFIDENTKVFLSPDGIRFVQGKSYVFLAMSFFCCLIGILGIVFLFVSTSYREIFLVSTLLLLAIPLSMFKWDI